MTRRQMYGLLCAKRRIMSSSPPSQLLSESPNVTVNRKDHTDLTRNEFRQDIASQAVVTNVTQLSPKVKGLTLRIEDRNLSFKSGQWVDMIIPGIEQIGGYSIYSSPGKLQREQCIDLAVKYATYPPAYWVHTKCHAGSNVSVRIGGNFQFDVSNVTEPYSLLLVAGGVGINPLCSIVQHAVEMKQENSNIPLERVTLLYSSSCVEELLFKDMLDNISKENDFVRCHYFVTREKEPAVEGLPVKSGRITAKVIQDTLTTLDTKLPKIYICGPPPMITDVENILLQQGLSRNLIFYEKWW